LKKGIHVSFVVSKKKAWEGTLFPVCTDSKSSLNAHMPYKGIFPAHNDYQRHRLYMQEAKEEAAEPSTC
jgi:hypothetical protein